MMRSAMESRLLMAPGLWLVIFLKCSRLNAILERLPELILLLQKHISKLPWILLPSSLEEDSDQLLHKMRFLLDESVHSGMFSFLSKLGHDVKLSPKIIKNGEVFSLSLKEERILVTRDSDFLDPAFTSSKHFGIWLIRLAPGDIEGQRQVVSRLLKQYPNSESFKDKVV